MKPLSSIEIKLCQKQGKIFEASVKKVACSSLIFIRRFMLSSIAKSFDDGLFLFASEDEDDVFLSLEEEFGESEYGQIKYSEEEMFWIGYIYRCIAIKYHLSSKSVYKLFNAKDIIHYYNICHTFDIVDAAERMMESISFKDNSIEERAYAVMKKLMYQERLSEYLGKTVDFIIDKSSISKGTDDKQNYAYVPGLKALNNDHQEAYVMGFEDPSGQYKGKVIAIISKESGDDKLVVSTDGERFSKEEIREAADLQKESGRKKIVMLP